MGGNKDATALLATLCDTAYPQVLRAASDAGAEAARLALLTAVLEAMAAARGLALPAGALGDVPAGLLDAARAALADLPLDRAPLTLPGELHAALLADRRARGSYYTPAALAAEVAALTLAGRTSDRVRVLDPAAGGGSFLLAAGDALAGPGSTPQGRWAAAQGSLFGVDADATAAALARAALWLWAACPGTAPADLAANVITADALLGDLTPLHPPFDVVLGNPPYLSVFARAGADGARRAALRARYDTAAGSFDLSVLFVERAIGLLREGGRAGLVLPNKLLAASYAEPLRRWLAERVEVEAVLDVSAAGDFAAGVYPVALVLRRAGHPAPGAPLRVQQGRRVRAASQRDLHGAPGAEWGGVLDPAWPALRALYDRAPRLADVAELAAGLTVGEAYDLRPRVFDAPPAAFLPDAARLLTTGLIRRHRALWGEADATFLKRRYRRPAVMLDALPPRRREQAAAHKLVVGGLGLRPRVVWDRGEALASVATVVVWRAAWPLGALAALLNASLVARLYGALYGGLALSGGYLRFGQRELAALPLPRVEADDPRLARLNALAGQIARADALSRPALDAEIDALVAALYGIDPAALEEADQL